MILKMVDELASSISVDHLKLDAFRNRMPFEVEESVKVISLFPSVLSQVYTALYYLRIVACTYYVL
jgi:hypothetical protein